MDFDAAVPPEPTELKPEIAAHLDEGEFTLSDEHDWVVPVTEPAPGRMIVDTDFGAHLWRAWEDELRDAGFTYQSFLTATTAVTATVGRWAADEEDWETVVAELQDAIEDRGDALTADLRP